MTMRIEWNGIEKVKFNKTNEMEIHMFAYLNSI